MNTSPYYLLGPITYPGPAFFTVNKSNVPYFLTLESNGELVFDPRQSATPLQLDLNRSTNGMQISFAGQNDQTLYISGKTTIVPPQTFISATSTSTQTTLIPVTTEVNPWTGNNALLTGVHYSFYTIDHKIIMWRAYVQSSTGIEMDDDGNPVIQYFSSDIRALPTKWYEAGSCPSTASTSDVISAEILWVQGQQVPNGYTLLSDCQTGVRYSYCGPKVTCSGRCKSTCANSDQVCMYNSTSRNFSCTIPSPTTNPIWKNVWFITIIAIIVVVVIVSIFVAIIIEANKRKK